jgi:glycosyltransferase involved in cell wall biosynthesis
MLKLSFDERWCGQHGIGRFASMIKASILPDNTVNYAVKPSSPFDIILLTFWSLMYCRGVFFSPGYNSPLFGYKKLILTIHDLNHIEFCNSLLKRFYYLFFIKSACKKAYKIITVSEFSRNKIIEWAGVPESSVINVGNGVDSKYKFIGSKYSPGFTYFFSVSNRKPHKNEQRMILAFGKSMLKSDIKLLITGHSTPDLDELIRNNGLVDKVIFCGMVPEDLLPDYYRGAIGLLFPSLYEGFGLPALEAMACGIPVIVSNTTSLPEVVDDAAILIDPLSVDQITDAINLISNDFKLRNTLIEKGLARAALFTWERTCALVSKVISEAKGE